MNRVNVNEWKGSPYCIVEGRPYGIVAKVLDCYIIVSKFKLQSGYYFHFWTSIFGKGINPLIPLAVG